MDESTTLEALLELSLHECEEEVKNIVDKGLPLIVCCIDSCKLAELLS